MKTVIITGGGTGIGLAAAKLLLEKEPETRVLLIGRRSKALEKAVESLGGLSDRLGTYSCDLRDPGQIATTVEKITAVNKTVYALVNNAGVYPFGGVAETTPQGWDDTLNVNLKAPFLLIQALLPAMEKSTDGARIVNISSTAGMLPNHFAMAYSVSKAGLIHLTKTLAKELGPKDITVNCICPGIVKSPLHEAYHRDRQELEEFYARRGASYPLGRVGEPEDVAGAIRYYLSSEAAWTTGDVMVVDGGRLLV